MRDAPWTVAAPLRLEKRRHDPFELAAVHVDERQALGRIEPHLDADAGQPRFARVDGPRDDFVEVLPAARQRRGLGEREEVADDARRAGGASRGSAAAPRSPTRPARPRPSSARCCRGRPAAGSSAPAPGRTRAGRRRRARCARSSSDRAVVSDSRASRDAAAPRTPRATRRSRRAPTMHEDQRHRCPSAVVVECRRSALQLLEVGADVFARGSHQRGVETIIDGFGDRLHRRVPGRERGDDLPFAQCAGARGSRG